MGDHVRNSTEGPAAAGGFDGGFELVLGRAFRGHALD